MELVFKLLADFFFFQQKVKFSTKELNDILKRAAGG